MMLPSGLLHVGCFTGGKAVREDQQKDTCSEEKQKQRDRRTGHADNIHFLTRQASVERLRSSASRR